MTDIEQLRNAVLSLSAAQVALDHANAKAAKLKSEARILEMTVLQLMAENNLTSIGHGGVLAAVKHTRFYHAKDWLQVYDYIGRTGEFDLLHKRLSNTAVRERFNNHAPVPGVEYADVPGLVLTAAGVTL